MLHPSVIMRKFLHVGHISLLLSGIELSNGSEEVFLESGSSSKPDASKSLLKLVLSMSVTVLLLSR